MELNNAESTDAPVIQEILDALDDTDCRAILRATGEPKTATQLVEQCAIAQSTIYRKLNLLRQASLVREYVIINPNGGRVTHYERDVDDVTISMDDDGISVRVDRPARNADERLTRIWSQMGNEY